MIKAIILASGIGSRLQHLTNSTPKSLVRIGNRTILDYQMESLQANGINELIITTGPFKEQLEEYVRSRYELKVRFVHNPLYRETNYIYSLWLTRDYIDCDVILMHGDLFFNNSLLPILIKSKGSHVLVNREVPPPEKDFKALVVRNRVIQIGTKLSGHNSYFCAPMYKLSKADFLKWMSKISEYIQQGKVNCYAEDAFNDISNNLILRPLYYTTLCMEIDTLDDLAKARSEIKA